MMDRRQAAIEYVRKLSPVDPNDPYIEQLQTCVHCDQPGTKDRPLLRESMDTSDSRGTTCVPVAVHGDCHLVAHTSGHEGLCTFPADQEPTPRTRELRARFEEDPTVRAMLETFGGELSNVKRPGGTNMSDEVMMTAKNWMESMTPEEKATFDHEWDVEFPATLQHHRSCAEEEWTKEKKVWSWIGGKGWQFGFGWYFLSPPQHACRRIIRLSLPEDGQLRVIEKFVPYHEYWTHSSSPHQGDGCQCHSQPTVSEFVSKRYQQRCWPEREEKFYLIVESFLMVTAEVGGILHHYRGTLQGTPPFEMSAAAVVFNYGTPQIVADRVAKTFDLTMQGAGENFFALLDGADHCAICRKPLRDEVSKLVAVGPDCARMYGIPHTLEAASKRLALRKTLLAE